ncbi:glycosyltransferase [Nocardioides sp. CCNWLW212]|uniref:glycosyltransferase n=1 Tax=Nocardioides sp. CCNWLW212 TaxID=3128897 RepID=UPI00307D6A95
MRALMVIAEMGTGGAETVVSDLVAHLADQGDHLAVASEPGWRAEHLQERGVRTVAVPLRSRGPGALGVAAARIRGEVLRRPVDVLHAHNVRASVAAHLGARWPARRTPLMSTVHGLAESDYPAAARVLDRVADRVVAVSDDVAARLEQHGLRRTRLDVVENAAGVAVGPGRDRARADLGIAPDVPVALCLARLAPPKRHDLLVEAWQRVPAPAVLLVAGDGEHRDRVEEQVRAAGLEHRVRLLGQRRDVARLLAAADVLVLPSDREGLPMTVLEAMAAGVPVVASAVGGLRSLDARTVELVAPGSPAALADGLLRVLGSASQRAEMAARGRGVAAARFSVETMRARYQRIYDELNRSRRP